MPTESFRCLRDLPAAMVYGVWRLGTRSSWLSNQRDSRWHEAFHQVLRPMRTLSPPACRTISISVPSVKNLSPNEISVKSALFVPKACPLPLTEFLTEAKTTLKEYSK